MACRLQACAALLLLAAATAAATTVYPQEASIFESMPPDANAINANDGFGLVGDGVHDDTDALEAAIEAAYAPPRPNCTQPGSRVIFLGPGRYRLSRPIDLRIWHRLVGWGTTRPILVLAPATPGYNNTKLPTPMLRANYYAPGAYTPSNATDGGNIAFAVGILNVNFEIGLNNPAAVALRWRVAQGGLLRAVAMNLSSDTLAGIHCPGWAHQDVVIRGGQYGILVQSTGAWPSSYRDLVLEGQTVAGVGDTERYPTWEGSVFTRTLFLNSPVAFKSLVTGSPAYPDPDGLVSTVRLIMRQCLFINITHALVSLGNVTPAWAGFTLYDSYAEAGSTNLALELTQPGLTSVYAPGNGQQGYHLSFLSVGNTVLGLETAGPHPAPTFAVHQDITLVDGPVPPTPPSDIPPLPYPVASWTNAVDYGVVGDGVTDVTAPLNALLARAAAVAASGRERPEIGQGVLQAGTTTTAAAAGVTPTIYLPTGVYLVSSTITIPAGVTLFGLHCWDVTVRLQDNTVGYMDPASPKPILHVTGDGGSGTASTAGPVLRVGGLNVQSGRWYGPQPAPVPAGWWNPNPGAVGLLWEAQGTVVVNSSSSSSSTGGTTTSTTTLSYPYPAHGLSDVFFHPQSFPDNPRLGSGSNTEVSLVIQGGNGVFTDIWTCNSYANGGTHVFDSAGPGIFYQLSDEHHAQHEVWMRNVTDWSIWTLQTEDRAADSNVTVPVACEACINVTVGGLITNRGPGCPPLPAVTVDAASTGITLLQPYGFPWVGRQPWNASARDGATGNEAQLDLAAVTVRTGPWP